MTRAAAAAAAAAATAAAAAVRTTLFLGRPYATAGQQRPNWTTVGVKSARSALVDFGAFNDLGFEAPTVSCRLEKPVFSIDNRKRPFRAHGTRGIKVEAFSGPRARGETKL